MKNFFTVFKLLLLNTFKKNSNKEKRGLKGSGMIWGLAILAIIMAIAVIAASLTVGVYFNSIGLRAEYLGFLFLISQLIVLIFGTVLLLNVMYFTKDISFLLPLPIKTQTIFWAKFAYVYVMELFFAGFLALVGGVTYLIVIEASVFSYFILVLAVLMLPMLPLIISSLLTLPIIYILSYFKSKGPLLAILLTAGFSAVMFFYMYFVQSMSVSAEGTNLVLSPASQKSIANFFNIFIPVGSLAKLVVLKDTLTNLWLFAASYAVLIFLIILLAKFTFKRSMQKQLEEAKGKTSSELKYSQNSIVKSLVKKDFKEIMRNPGLAFNCLITVILGPIMIIAFGLTSKSISISEAGLNDLTNLIFGIMFVAFMPLGINFAAISSISREGQNFYHLKVFPTHYQHQLSAKVIVAKIPAFLAIILSGIAFIIFMQANIFISLGIIIFSLIFADGYVYYLVSLDLKRPKLVYDSVMAALKNSKNSMLAMIVALGLILPLIIALTVFMSLLYNNINIILFWTIVFVPIFIYALILNFVFRKKLKENGIRQIEQIEP